MNAKKAMNSLNSKLANKNILKEKS